MKIIINSFGLFLFLIYFITVALSIDPESDNENDISDDDSSLDDLAGSLEKCALDNTAFTATKDIPNHPALSCLDGKGEKVDWWFMYKEPRGFCKIKRI